jgi:hypothetical protein
MPLCIETGSHEAVKLQHLKLDLARDIDKMIGASIESNGGYASILLKMEKGVVTVIDWTMRRFRNKKTPANN